MSEPNNSVDAIKSEIVALQNERVAHETEMQKRSRELHDQKIAGEAKLREEWHGGLRDLDVRIRNAQSRLGEAQATVTRAAAVAAAEKRDERATSVALQPQGLEAERHE